MIPLRRTSWALVPFLLWQGGGPGGARLLGQVPDSAALVRGRVVEHETGRTLWGAAVSLASGPDGTRGIGTRVTGEDGSFLFREVPSGLYRLTVTLMGYRTLRDTLRVDPVAELDLDLPLSTSPVALAPIVVVGRREPPSAAPGFDARRRRLGGTFLNREEIEDRAPMVFTDLLRMVPGARVVPVGQFGNGVLFRGGCRPEIWMDGMRLLPTLDLDALLMPQDLEAVEVYPGAFLPVEFGPSSCGAIVVWTRQGERDPRPGNLLRKILFGGALVALAWLLAG